MLAGDTKDRILDAAEALFAERGYAGASMREIARRSGANLAAAHYHFGSKEELLQAVFARRIQDVNTERLKRLTAIELGPEPVASRSPKRSSRSLDLERVIEVFVAPAMEMARDTEGGGAAFARLMGRVLSDSSGPLSALVACGAFDEVRERFGTAFARIQPDLRPQELAWRMHFMVGAMAHTILHPEMVARIEGDDGPPGDDHGQRYLVRFLAGAMGASADANLIR